MLIQLAWNAQNFGHTTENTIRKPGQGLVDINRNHMENIIHFVTSQDWLAWVGATTALLTAVIAVCQLIPGDQPEKTLQTIVDFLSKFSRK